MKNNIFNVFLLLGVACSMSHCKRLDVMDYENDPRLYFFKGYLGGDTQKTDSLVQSFFFVPDEQETDTVYVDLRTMGMSADFARPFRLVQVNQGDAGAAIAGKHFISFDSDTIRELWKMPAEQVQYWVPVILKRDPSLNTEKVELKLAIVENEHFRPGINQQLQFRIVFTAKADKPSNWDTFWWVSFGDWGERKMWFVMWYVGITDFTDNSIDYNYRQVLKSVAQELLKQYNETHGTLTEADGTEVKF